MNHNELALITGEQLAKLHGYSAVTASCRAWWKSIGVEALPGRKNIYDPRQVRARLDLIAGVQASSAADGADKPSLTEQRRARKNAQR